MINKIIASVPFLVGQGTKCIGGLAEHAGELNVPHSVAVDLPGRLAALSVAEVAYHEAKIQLREVRTELENAVSLTRRFMMVARETLKPTLGVKYSQSWGVAGFSRNLQLPRSAEPLLLQLHTIKDYLAAHPIVDAGPHLTGARAGALFDDLARLVAALADRKHGVDQAFTTRNEKLKAMEKGLRTLLSELHLVLDPLDSRWFAFGFQKPGQKRSPAAPENVSVTPVSSTAMEVKWEPSPGATHYRVSKKVIGVDEDYVAIGSPADPNFTFEEFPFDAEVEVAVSAVSRGGESRRSEVVRIQT